MSQKTTVSESELAIWVAAIKRSDLNESLSRIAHVKKEHLVVLLQEVTRDKSYFRKGVKAASKVTGVPEEVLNDVLGPLMAFAATIPKELNVSEAITILAKNGVVSVEVKSDLQQSLVELEQRGLLKTIGSFIETKTKNDQVVGSSVPRLKGAWTRCIHIGHFDPDYTLDDESTRYNPNLVACIGVVVLQLDVNRYGHVDRFAVGLTEEELSEMIHRLTLAKKQLESMNADIAIRKKDGKESGNDRE